MTKLIKWLSSRSRWQLLALGLAALLAAAAVLLLVAGFFTKTSLRQLSSSNPAAASQSAIIAQNWLKPLSKLGLANQPDFQVWLQALNLLQNSSPYFAWATSISLTPTAATSAPPDPSQIFSNLNQLAESYQQSWLLPHYTPATIDKFLSNWLKQGQAWQQLIKFLLQPQLKVLILFQNSNELRATGGFLGSYALVDLESGQLNNLVIEDIYDADGQFQGFVSAPPGVAQYLSANRGLRLPDSNWSPDFAQSAQQVLQYFALGDRSGIQLVVAINQQLVSDLLELTGPIYLPDYHTMIDVDNLDQVLENRQDEFFAGSIRKKHLLTHFFTQLSLKLAESKNINTQKLLTLVQHWQTSKTIQFFSPNPDIQTALEQLDLAGNWQVPADTDVIVWTESNVGINKVNDQVQRELNLNLSEQKTSISAHFVNQDNKLAYINYQRLWLPTNWQLLSANSSGVPINSLEERPISDSQNQAYLEVAFLLEVPPNSEQTVELEFARQDSPRPDFQKLLLVKQAGLPVTAVTVTTPAGTEALAWESNLIL